ncbi:transglutaminaseTgpA domain-containing protein [Variovorax sp. HJSM1_2]|uniref:transglutaminase family protein n=1 Tax=Variovorax sp. HJSM1_2 TaxID=3366263 RepID=UPI003BC963B8
MADLPITPSSTASPWQSARQTLAALPRDSRDTLFLLVVVAWVVLPQIGNLPWWVSLGAGCLLAWRGWLAWHARPLPNRWWLLALLGLAMLATLATHRTLVGRDAGVTLVVLLLVLKTLELRARRDAFVVFFLGFFTMLTNFFFSQSLLTAVAMLIGLLGLLTALVNAHLPVGRPPLAESARMAGWMALLGAPVMLALFMLFPRMAPLWGMPSDAMSGRSGLSGSMQVGDMASLVLSDAIALRVRFADSPPAQNALYFRGPVLSEFDGRQWRPRYANAWPGAAREATLTVNGTPLRYEATVEPNNRPWLLLLDATPNAPNVRGDAVGNVAMTPDLQWLASRPLTDLTRYSALSYPAFRHGPELRRSARLLADLALPPGFNPRTLQLAADMRREAPQASAAQQLEAVLQRLRTGGYSYTLEPGVYGQHTADEFWFDRKAGFCEHFASSFVILMRALDIPARVVTGYQGGQVNNLDGYWTVRQSDAHAWAEVWLEDQGWVRVDPTATVAPGRVGALERLAAPQGVFGTALGTVSPTAAAQLRAVWEAVNNRWNQWVLNYTQTRQLDLLKSIGFEAEDWQDLLQALGLLLAGVCLAGAAWTLLGRRTRDPWQQLHQRAQAYMRKAGIAVPPHAGPRQMAALLQAHGKPAATHTFQAWLLQLEIQRYAPEPGVSLARLRRTFPKLAE